MVKHKLREIGGEEIIFPEQRREAKAAPEMDEEFPPPKEYRNDAMQEHKDSVHRIIKAAQRIRRINPNELNYGLSRREIMEAIMPKEFIKACQQYQELGILGAGEMLQCTLAQYQNDKELKRKIEYLKMQLILDTQFNDKIEELLRSEMEALKKRVAGIQKLVGLKFTNNSLKLELQDVTYKNCLNAQVSLKIDRYSGAVDIESVYVKTKFTVENHLVAFQLNPALQSQKERLWRLLKNCTLNALKLYGVREFRLGFFMIAKPLYNILEDICIVSINYALKDIEIEEDEINVSFEVVPLHQDFQTTLNLKASLTRQNEFKFQLAYCRIEPLFTTRCLKLEEFQTCLRNGKTIRKQVMTPWKMRDADWKKHDYKVVMKGYYDDLKKCWKEVNESPSYHKILDMAILTQEIFYYDD